jgi:hypothetical protein
MYQCGERPLNLGPSVGSMAQPVEQVERRRLNSELWHACAGPLVSLPPVGTQVVYFPQGHTEQVLLCLNSHIYAFLLQGSYS